MSLVDSLKRTAAQLKRHRGPLLESWIQALADLGAAPLGGWPAFCERRLDQLLSRLEKGELDGLLEDETREALETSQAGGSFHPVALSIRALDRCCLPFLIDSCPDKNSLAEALLGLDELGDRRLEAVVRAQEEEALRLLTEAQDQAALLAEKARDLSRANTCLAAAEARAERRVEQIGMLAAVARRITGVLDPETLLAEAAQAIQSGSGARYVAVVVLDNEGMLVGRWAGSGGVDRRSRGRAQGPVGGVIGRALRKRAPQVARNVSSDPDYQQDVAGTLSEMVVPLLEEGTAIGVLDFQSDHAEAFDLDDVAAGEAVADFVTIALRNARLVHDLKQANRAARPAVGGKVADEKVAPPEV